MQWGLILGMIVMVMILLASAIWGTDAYGAVQDTTDDVINLNKYISGTEVEIVSVVAELDRSVEEDYLSFAKTLFNFENVDAQGQFIVTEYPSGADDYYITLRQTNSDVTFLLEEKATGNLALRLSPSEYTFLKGVQYVFYQKIMIH